MVHYVMWESITLVVFRYASIRDIVVREAFHTTHRGDFRIRTPLVDVHTSWRSEWT